ncbi:MAG: tRNA pseudouridine(55) synthase TruB [Pseudonocardiales bacterium]|nr:MAG: tRNA pseudouridine(55) synthase TruB [Pseudonocardiales bacterium]
MSPADGGLCVVDKPAGLTSHDVVAQVRRLAGTRRVGHAGTLDPMATGVLVLGIERATRLLGHLALTDKSYDATIRLGQSTVSDDADGEVVAAVPASHLTDLDVRTALPRLVGEIEQVPSAVSAIKVDGRRAYARVRAGEEVALAPRRVTVARLDLLAVRRDRPDLVDLEVSLDCSTGTYVRAIARDLGAALGVGGHLTALRRTRVGPFTLAGAHSLDALAALSSPVTLGLAAAVAACFSRRDVDWDQARLLSHGRPLPAAGITGTYGAFAPDGAVLALLAESDALARPVVVLAPAAAPGGA